MPKEKKSTQPPPLISLKDEAISSISNDDFDHDSIAKSLETLIKSSPVPSTIGLLANWGSGKSGVTRLLKNHVQENKRVGFVEFDVWKYEDEQSIRRQFMHTMHKQLKKQGLLGDAKLSERLKGSVTKDINDGVEINQAGLAKFIILGFAIALALGMSIYFDAAWLSALTILVGIIAIVGVESIIKTGLGVFQNKKHSITLNKLTDADEFEDEFRDLISTSPAEKIIVVIDNLDRATDDKALNILATIKSFLEYGKCVYIIPCDEDAIKKHLQNTLGGADSEHYDSDEFLRKFFNTYLRIPPFISADLQDFTEKLLKLTNFQYYYPDIQNVATIITAAYRKNPRQIKQFINVFISHYMLALEREGQNLLPPGDITNNPEFLAKILIIHQRWQDAYDKLFDGIAVNDASGNDEYQEFLKASSLAEEPDNTKSFLYFKRSTRASNLPPGTAEPLQTAVEDAKYEDAKLILDQIQSGSDHTDALNQFVLELIHDASQKNRQQVLANIFFILSQVWSNNIIKLSSDVKQKISKTIADRMEVQGIINLETKFVLDCLLTISNSGTRKSIIKIYLSGIGAMASLSANTSDTAIKSLEFLKFAISDIKQTQALFKEYNTNIQTFFSDLSVVKYLHSNLELTKLFNSETIDKLSSSINVADLDDNGVDIYTLKSEILISLPKITRNAIDYYLDMARYSLAESLRGPSNIPFPETILDLLLEFINKWLPEIKNNNVVKTFVDELVQTLESRPSGSIAPRLGIVLLKITSKVDPDQQEKIKSAINSFIQSNSSSEVREWVERSITEGFDPLDSFYSPIYDRAINDEEFANIIWSFGDDHQKISIIDGLLVHNSTRGLNAIDSNIDSIQDLKSLSELLLRFSNNAPSSTKLVFYERIARAKVGNDLGNKEIAIQQLIHLSKQPDEASRSIARDAFNLLKKFLSKKLKAAMNEDLLAWMELQGKLNYTYIPLINLIFENFEALSSSQKTRLYVLIFDQWLLQESDSQQLIRACELALDNISKKELAQYIKKLLTKKDNEPYLAEQILGIVSHIGSNLE